MLPGQPCFTTVFGQNIRLVVLHIGLLELVLTLAATTLNVIKYTQYVQLFGEDCAGKDVCLGPLIKVKCPSNSVHTHQFLSTRYLTLLPEFSVLSC